MWVAKLKVWHANSYSMEKTAKLDAAYYGYNLNTFEKDGATWIARVMLATGPQADRLIKEILDDPRIIVEQVKGRQVFFAHPAKTAFHDNLLDRRVFFLKPIYASGGREYWTVASFHKKSIGELFRRLNRDRKISHAEMLSLKRESVDVFMPGVLSGLSGKQRWAYEAACRHGYYRYPREHDAKEIAGILKVPESTFREHLRKAEAKLLPALHEWLADTYSEA
jgi:predicted DNA binding protein